MSNSYYDGGYNKRGGGGGGGGRNSAGDASKIFVGGLNRDTSDDDMRNYFSKYGTVTECMVKKDPNTGTSRGFGFVTFADSSSVDLVVGDRSHILQGKTIDPKRAKARTGLEGITKVFVGGLDPNLPEQDIRDYFQRFGKIDTLELPYDREKNMRRGFCFVSFESSDAVDTLCASAKHTIGGREVDVKKATPKGEQRENNQHGGRGGRNGGAPASDPYASAGWGAQPGYPAAPAPYGAAYDYSAYYAQQAAYPGYGPPAAGGYADPYAQAYAATGAYDYSAWYGATPTAPAGQPAANGSGGPYGRSQRGGASDNRYQPY